MAIFFARSVSGLFILVLISIKPSHASKFNQSGSSICPFNFLTSLRELQLQKRHFLLPHTRAIFGSKGAIAVRLPVVKVAKTAQDLFGESLQLFTARLIRALGVQE